MSVLPDGELDVLAVTVAFRRFLLMVDIRAAGGKLPADDVVFLAGSPCVNQGLGTVRFLLIKDAFCPFHFLASEIRLGEGYAQWLIVHRNRVPGHCHFHPISVITGVLDDPGCVYGKEDVWRCLVAFRRLDFVVAVVLSAFQDTVQFQR